MKRGKFIVFEGCEGSGKTSVLKLLREKMAQEGLPSLFTREPGGTTLGREIRTMLMRADGEKTTTLTDVFLFCADRVHHISDVIKPALRRGEHVMCDRFSYSTIAYQGDGRGEAGMVKKATALDRMAREGLCPDVVIYLDITPEVGLKRVELRNEMKTRFDAEEIAFHHRVRRGFLRMHGEGKKKKKRTWFLVDASQSQEVVAAEVWGIVRAIVSR